VISEHLQSYLRVAGLIDIATVNYGSSETEDGIVFSDLLVPSFPYYQNGDELVSVISGEAIPFERGFGAYPKIVRGDRVLALQYDRAQDKCRLLDISRGGEHLVAIVPCANSEACNSLGTDSHPGSVVPLRLLEWIPSILAVFELDGDIVVEFLDGRPSPCQGSLPFTEILSWETGAVEFLSYCTTGKHIAWTYEYASGSVSQVAADLCDSGHGDRLKLRRLRKPMCACAPK
jgi:hypothetical protein